MTTTRATRLPLPALRVFDDASPLLSIPRFGLTIARVSPSGTTTSRVIAELHAPRRIQKDVLTVQCSVDGVRFELMQEGTRLTPVVTHMEKTLGQTVDAMRTLPSVALSLLVFDHRARSGVREAVAAVGLIDWFAPRANERKLGETNSAVRDADHAMEEAFSAAARWMENGHG